MSDYIGGCDCRFCGTDSARPVETTGLDGRPRYHMEGEHCGARGRCGRGAAMKTTMTLGEIRNAVPRPCEPGWKKLIAACGTSDDAHVVDLRDILRSNGPKDAWWATRCLPPRGRVALALRAARTVERLSPAAKECNDVTERWLRGDASDEELASEAAEMVAWAAWAASEAAAMAASEAAARAAWVASAASAAAARAARAPAWKNLGEIMLQWCAEQDEVKK